MSLRLLRKTTRTLVVPMGAEGENDPTKVLDDKKDDAADDASDDGGDEPEVDKTQPVSREDFDKLFQRMQAADRRATAAETKVKEQDRAKMDDLTRTQSELDEAKTKLADAENALKVERLHNAFLASNTITWHNPRLAMKELDLEGVQKDDGTVDEASLKKAITALAKAQPYLVKNDDSEGGGKKGNGPTGAGVGTDMGGNSDKKSSANREALLKKYPALRTGR